MHRLNMEVDPKFIWAPCHVMCTAELIGTGPQSPPHGHPAFGLDILYECAIGQQR